MKKNILIVLPIFYCIANSYCQNNKKQTDLQNSNKRNQQEIMLIEKVLKSQLVDGKEKGGDEYESHEYTEKDLDASISLLNQELISNGYKLVSKIAFSDKIKKVFGRIIDYNSKTKHFYINFYDKCDKKPIYSSINVISNGIFVIKQESFITKLYAIPEIIDYQKKFPNVVSLEDKKIFKVVPDIEKEVEIPHWKDIPNLKEIRKKNIQTLVARNMYLFNNSRAHFRWLLVNDEYFMRSLVTTFGYTEDAELLEWVVEKTNFNDQDELNKLFYNAKCDGTTQLNTAVFPALKKYITPKNKIVLEQLQKYLFKLIDLQNEFAGLHFKERTELIARLSYFGELYRFKPEFEYTNYDNNYFIFSIFTFDTSNRFKTEMKNKNYYGLPDFMKLYDKAEKEYSKYYYKSIGE